MTRLILPSKALHFCGRLNSQAPLANIWRKSSVRAVRACPEGGCVVDVYLGMHAGSEVSLLNGLSKQHRTLAVTALVMRRCESHDNKRKKSANLRNSAIQPHNALVNPKNSAGKRNTAAMADITKALRHLRARDGCAAAEAARARGRGHRCPPPGQPKRFIQHLSAGARQDC